MRKFVLLLLCWCVSAPAAFSMAAGLNLESALRDADLIARVKVVSVKPAPEGSGYRQLARATITDSAKGAKEGESVELLCDNGFVCPNVLYQAGEDCIVFAKRRADGSFETMNTYAGKFQVENGSAQCYLLIERGQIEDKRMKATEIIGELRRRMAAVVKAQ